ncbi:2-hydroxyglutaryl-CoA dehydratase [Citricoccus zhacaiensis]|uniref:2-hydroxyglutaryl-CoA dehydratase n=1 Tax=Citricoccus zhacaiensis TaxID=489142 RepID=A0ABQ2LY96_9MICC|nr:2-hydroxyacyl-CoA dehydratase family protein [Citricoccus zhacaiensis]GGO43683.1 2-hydroxyglutaryl-CoA dehydratase [Citricoccus zhacaiensis]
MTTVAADTRATSKVNRLKLPEGQNMVNEYWEDIFSARERGQKVVWYNGSAVNPFFQAAGLSWAHGEAFSARLAAQELEKPAQLAAEEYGYAGELCSYARTHLGCAVLTESARSRKVNAAQTGIVGLADQEELASRLPTPDFFVNAYAGCSTGQQWDEITYRVFGKKVPIYNVDIPFLWGNKPDSTYLGGEEWEGASDYVEDQLKGMIGFIEEQTGNPFDMDALSQNMAYIKRASELRREAMALCKTGPAPATFWDWIASIAHINFMPASEGLVTYFQAVKDEIESRLENNVSGIANERYRLYFDGIMNWNKLGELARLFASYDVSVVAGRYTHNAFWQEPHLIDPENPLRGMAQHYLLCPTNHGVKTLKNMTNKDLVDYDLDGLVFHSTRTCRAFAGPQHLLAKSAEAELGLPSIFFEGDVADASFYKGEMLATRLEGMLESIDIRRTRAS